MMIKNKKKTKKKVNINGQIKKLDHDVFMLIRNQDEMLKSHEGALLKYVQTYLKKKKPNKDEKVIYQYCMQIRSVVNTLEYLKNQEDEKKDNS